MPLNIRSEEVNRLATELAASKHVNKTEAVRLALENELLRMADTIPLGRRLTRLQDDLAAYPDTAVVLDKAFFDGLSGDFGVFRCVLRSFCYICIANGDTPMLALRLPSDIEERLEALRARAKAIRSLLPI